MRILQLIDSLDPGGAERMAVNYANVLSDSIKFSALVVTRKEGALKTQLSDNVSYLFLDKKKTLDLRAIFRLRKFIQQNSINIIHAHSTSFFLSVLVKITYPKVKIIWHDHHGNRVSIKGNTNKILKYSSLFFHGVLAVNKELENWAKNNLFTKKITYFPNFVDFSQKEISVTKLKGEDGKRIVFLANLKNPKNHLFFLEAFFESGVIHNNWSLHIIGKDFEDKYSEELKKYITNNKIEASVFIYGSCNDISSILIQAKIGVLASTYEGFPVTLLEYGKAKLAVLSTNVGYCSELIQDSRNGIVFNPYNKTEVTNKLQELLYSEKKINVFSKQLYQDVFNKFSEKSVVEEYLKWLS